MRFSHGLKICTWFGYNLQIIFCHSSQVDQSPLAFLDIIYIKVNGQGTLCVRNFSCSLILLLLKLHRSFGQGLKICMWFGYNPQIIFDTFYQVELSHFFLLCVLSQFNLLVHDSSYIKRQTLSGRGHKFSVFECLLCST